MGFTGVYIVPGIPGQRATHSRASSSGTPQGEGKSFRRHIMSPNNTHTTEGWGFGFFFLSFLFFLVFLFFFLLFLFLRIYLISVANATAVAAQLLLCN